MEIKELEANYTYDSRIDVVNIEVKQEYDYEVSLDLEPGVYLHFDDNYFPMGLEIIDASKKMGVNKLFLANPTGNVEIIIDEESINVKIVFENMEENGIFNLNSNTESFIPNLETKFALV